MKTWIYPVLGILIAIAVAVAVVLGLTAIVWFLYNIVVAPCFNGPPVGFWTTFGILGLLRVLVLFFRGR